MSSIKPSYKEIRVAGAAWDEIRIDKGHIEVGKKRFKKYTSGNTITLYDMTDQYFFFMFL